MKRSIFPKEYQRDEALITSMIPYGDKSYVVRLFIKSKGRVSLFARNPKGLQTPSFALIEYLPPKDGLGQLKSFKLDSDLFLLARSLNTWTYFSYMAEIIENIVPEEEPAEDIFLDAKKLYQKSLKIGAHPQMIRAFEIKLLAYAGFLPDLTTSSEVVAFDPISCKFLNEKTMYSVPFNKKAVDLAYALLSSPIDEIFCEDIDILKAVGRIFFFRLKSLKKHELKSLAFLKEINKK